MSLFDRIAAKIVSRGIQANDPEVFGGGLDYFGMGMRHSPKTANWLAKYGDHANLQAIVRRVSSDTAMVKWNVFNEIPGGANGGKLRRNFGHRLEKLWNRPNPHMVGYQFRYTNQVYLETDGEAFVVLERPPGQLEPVAMYPIPSTWVTQRPCIERPYWEVCLGSKALHLPAGEVVWLHDPDPLNPYGRGLGTARSLDDEVQQDEWMAKFNNQFFRQGGHGGQVFALNGVEPSAAAQVKESYEQKYSGLWSAFKTVWLAAPKGGDIKVHSLGASHKDMDFVEGRKAARDAMMVAWNMPRFEMGISEDVNRASAQASDYTKSKNVTLPRVTYLEEAWAAWLVPLFGDATLRLIPENPVRQTEEFKLALTDSGWLGGTLTRNEWRIANGWDPLTDGRGEQILEPLNMTPAGSRVLPDAALNSLEALRLVNPEGAQILETTWRRYHADNH